jgi:hypothetical protein
MRFVTVTTEQRTPEWFAARCGRVTGSGAADMLARIKTGEAAARRDLRVRLVVERLTGLPQSDGYQSPEMKWGTEHEAEACRMYEAVTGELVRPVGFLAHPELLAGCSPDGEVNDCTGIIEIKCPKSATHLRYLRARGVPSEHLDQIRHNLFITGAAWCDFVSYDPRFPPPLQLLVERVTFSDADRKAYELLLRMFLAEVDREYAEVAALAARAAA